MLQLLLEPGALYHSTQNSTMVRASGTLREYFPKSGMLSFLERDGLSYVQLVYSVLWYKACQKKTPRHMVISLSFSPPPFSLCLKSDPCLRTLKQFILCQC